MIRTEQKSSQKNKLGRMGLIGYCMTMTISLTKMHTGWKSKENLPKLEVGGSRVLKKFQRDTPLLCSIEFLFPSCLNIFLLLLTPPLHLPTYGLSLHYNMANAEMLHKLGNVFFIKAKLFFLINLKHVDYFPILTV